MMSCSKRQRRLFRSICRSRRNRPSGCSTRHSSSPLRLSPSVPTHRIYSVMICLQATIQWLDGELTPVRDILMNDLLPMSRKGLERMQIDTNDIDHYLGILEARVTSGRNGATWQRNWVQQHGADMDALSMQRQQTEVPVHEWDV